MSPYTRDQPLEKKLIYFQMGEIIVSFSEMYKVKVEVVLSCYCVMSNILSTFLSGLTVVDMSCLDYHH